MLVSIVIPCYEMKGRGGEFLATNLTQIQNQSYKNVEVIVCDHSQNSVVYNVVQKYQAQINIVYKKNKYKRGSSSANVNVGMQLANGDIIKFIFQDDFFYDNQSLAHIVNAFTPSTNWLLTACCHTNDGKTMYRPFSPVYHHNILTGNNTVSSPSVVAIRRFKDLITYDESLVQLMDCDYYYTCFKRYGKPTILNKITVVNRLGVHQVSENDDKQEIIEKEKAYVLKKHKKTYTKKQKLIGRLQLFLGRMKHSPLIIS